MPKYKNGDIVGAYTVLECCADDPRKVRCRCNKCGSIVDVCQHSLSRHRMCRYCRTVYNTKPRIDLTGQRFGRLVAIKYVVREGKQNGWECKCDCGNTVVVITGHLRSGHTQSCGCYRVDRTKEANTDDLTGKRFNRLVVINRIENYMTPSGNPLTQYHCKCDCGNELDVLAMNLVSGNTQSCGCIGDSLGESTIDELLRAKEVSFRRQYSFPDLVSDRGYRLRFDFALFNKNDKLNCLIEYHGEQHYYEDSRGNHFFGKQQREETDPKKVSYCNQHGIKLFVIKYDEDITSRINDILKRF